MGHVVLVLSEPIPDLACDNCGKEHRYDPLMGWGCIVLVDERNMPKTILGAWCDDDCLKQTVRFRYR